MAPVAIAGIGQAGNRRVPTQAVRQLRHHGPAASITSSPWHRSHRAGRPWHAVSSGDVNAYLREITGADITAKDFRTWAGTMLMARYLTLAEPFASKGQAKRVMSAAVKKVAAALGNTAAVCRKSYIHPAISDAYLNGAFVLKVVEESSPGKSGGPRPDEIAVLALLRSD